MDDDDVESYEVFVEDEDEVGDCGGREENWIG
jgi:hypothetical protein